MTSDRRENLWAVVLAAGEGRRLAELTRALYGRDLPKQFAAIGDDRSLLQATVERLVGFVPTHRIVVVVGQGQERIARAQLAGSYGVDLVVQPRNLETGPGVLLPLARVLARDPSASVAIFPSDHYVPHPEPFLDGVSRAVAARERVTLLGVRPDEPESDYGWIVPGAPIGGGFHEVRGFVEKPEPDIAEGLLRAGGLWNTFVAAGSVEAFWKLALEHLPEQTRAFAPYVHEVDEPGERSELERIYSRLKPANFSRDVLERTDALAVLPIDRAGWSDWGSPRRVFRSLEGSWRHRRLQDQLAGRELVAG
ncbi:MAG TPA: sugar phosphate nucleotidyltransferase [Planctomycetota bacterium]|nr:sugar phosphate nucleotidyltransferase [Planctomycetota bacterium]